MQQRHKCQLNINMKLWELLNQSAGWSWRSKGDRSWAANFSTGSNTFWVYFDGHDGDKVELTFIDDQRSDEITGRGDSFKVFATVADIVREFMSKRSPSMLVFTAEEPSRIKLYARLAKNLASELGANLSTGNQGSTRVFRIIPDRSHEEEGDLNEHQLNELFDSRGRVRWDRDSPMSTAHFSMGSEDYTVMFWHGRDGTNISFMMAREGQKDDTGLTGSGNSFKVFAQVSQIILEYIGQDRPERFDFQGDGASRIKLYDKLSNLLVKKFPQYELEVQTLKTDAKSYHFSLKAEPYESLHEDGKIIPNVNTTCDVQPGETNRQAAKFGNKLDAKGRPPLLSGSYGDDTARFSAIQGDPFYGSDGTRLPKNKKWS